MLGYISSFLEQMGKKLDKIDEQQDPEFCSTDMQ